MLGIFCFLVWLFCDIFGSSCTSTLTSCIYMSRFFVNDFVFQLYAYIQLPRYDDEETLERNLRTILEHNTSFGMS